LVSTAPSVVAKDDNADSFMTDEPENYANDVAMDLETEDDGSDQENVDDDTAADERGTDHDWHAEEATARPEAIAERFNRDMGPMYKLRSQRKASFTDFLFS
jgi:hypothetical protein